MIKYRDGCLAERNRCPSFFFTVFRMDIIDTPVMDIDELYMRRCLQLASNGRQNAKPNPMVGAVIVCGGRIIGEGYHVRCGEGHAEVNAFASVRPQDEHLLPDSTMYVSLEPCSHYGKTPPCADLIIRKGVKRVVVGCLDRFAKVNGNGIRKLREAGIEVKVGVLQKECEELNRNFFTFNTASRPYILLKWCQTANGFLDDNFKPVLLSTPFTQMLVHKLRAEYDAILVGRVTAERDKPRLDVRLWSGKNPLRLVIDKRNPCFPQMDFSAGAVPVPQQICQWLYEQKKQSLIVEGGAYTLQSFIDLGLWDEIRIETAPVTVTGGTKAPCLPQHGSLLVGRDVYGGNTVDTFRNTVER